MQKYDALCVILSTKKRVGKKKAKTFNIKKVLLCITNITRNLIICNPSMYDYMQPNVIYNYKWLPIQLLLKFGWSLVLFSTRLRQWPISYLNCVIFYNVFVFFTTLYIHLMANVTKIVTCYLCKVYRLPR
jgi:hypothetical protein